MPSTDIMGNMGTTKQQSILENHAERLFIIQKNLSDAETKLRGLRNRIFGEDPMTEKNGIAEGEKPPIRPCAMTTLNEAVDNISKQTTRLLNLSEELIKLA